MVFGFLPHTTVSVLKTKTKFEARPKLKVGGCSARDWDGKDYLRIIPRVVW